MSEETSPRGTTVCRGCDRTTLVPVLNLGDQPLSNELAPAYDTAPELFPLHLRICSTCGLGQVGEFVRPERIFGDDYPYLSSTSTSWVAHASAYADEMGRFLDLGPEDLVLEIASNDGYLLTAFQEAGHRVLGIEPAQNVAEIARSRGVPTLNEFWGRALAEQVVAEHGHPRLVVANNVMAHVPDLHDFVAGLAVASGPGTWVTVENPSMLTMLDEAQFDTIYHEHFSYLSATSVGNVASLHGLDLVRVDQLATHGGSNRYFLRPSGSTLIDDSVRAVGAEELERGLLDEGTWQRFADTSRTAIDNVRAWLEQRVEQGRRLAGYGAAAKGSTLLNAVGGAARHLTYVADASSAKQGRFIPGPQVPIVPPEHLATVPVDDVLVLPWNLAAELVPIVRRLAPGARTWVPLPRVEEVR